ncbi:MAG: glycoside hydrolase family 78 protein [Prevotella sp.]|jgi:alpha-L-rhamnosidase|nr:glycoside hydrolase family 78 protein [Prevotella sp.]
MLVSCDNPITIKDLKCENLINPNAIDNIHPHFSWKIQYKKVQMQLVSYEIQVGTDSLELLKDLADLWDSGKIISESSIMIPYAGKELSSRTLCYWRVRVWNEKEEVSDWSDIARFGTGIIEDDSIQGCYIGLPIEAGNIQTPLLRKKFSLDKISTSFLHVNSLGYHEVYVNGKKVGNDVLSPAVSQLNKRSLIVTYDITSYLNKGDNDLVLWLGSGWYKKTTFGAAYDGPLVKAQLDILESGNWKTLLSTDSSWMGTQTGYSDTGSWRPHQFGGERVDAKLNPKDLTYDVLDKLSWVPIVEISVPGHTVSPQMTQSNKTQETITPKEIKQINDSTWFVDMGKALNGWFEIKLPNISTNQQVLIEYTDFLENDGSFIDQGQSDIYIASGDGNDIFCNKFNHHAFQYVRISGLKKEPDKKYMKAYLIHTDFDGSSTFECSDTDINAIHNLIQYTMRCLTFSGYMVDCPHFERLGYGGDGNSSTESLQMMYNVSSVFMNWLQAWEDSMREGGSLPHVAPSPYSAGGGPYWCGFVIMAPWRTYVNYNDKRLIERYYPLMKKWLEYVEEYTVDGILKLWPNTEYRNWYLGDWLAPTGVDTGAESSIDLVNNCFISECFATMEKIADVLNIPEDAEKFAKRRDDLNKLLQEKYFDPDKNIYSTGSQLDLSYPMSTGITPQSLYDKVKEQLFKRTNENYNDHIACGLVGVPILTKWAIENNAVDFMYSMLKKRDYPGYLHMIDRGASTTWEYWSAERSRIHNCYNGIGTWFYQALGGIRLDEENPGYRHIFIEPQIPDGMTWAKTSLESPYGTVSTNWKLESGKFKMEVVLPIGCKATVILPENAQDYKLNGNNLDEGSSFGINNGKHLIEASLIPAK